jgi:DNA-binding MarR family transcriptional regulator
LSRRIRFEREDDSLTLNQMSALGRLEKLGPLPVGELAAHERVRPPSMTRIVANLEDIGLVAREPDPADRRIVYVHITDSGHARMRADRQRRDAWLAQQLKELTPDERRKLREALPVLDRLARS